MEKRLQSATAQPDCQSAAAPQGGQGVQRGEGAPLSSGSTSRAESSSVQRNAHLLQKFLLFLDPSIMCLLQKQRLQRKARPQFEPPCSVEDPC